jgi:hypothetical protein
MFMVALELQRRFSQNTGLLPNGNGDASAVVNGSKTP